MMTKQQASQSAEPSCLTKPRLRTSWTAFILGIPLAVGILSVFYFGPLREAPARRYVSHPVECVEVVLFCCAVAAFAAKFWRSRTEKRACRAELVPPWAGQPIRVSEAGPMLSHLQSLPGRWQETYIVSRIRAILHFLWKRGSAGELDDQLRALSDTDFLALESSYSLTRFITWAITILGFLGTVLGITASISGVTPDVLENDLSKVTDGLALAFDATALGLALTMITMFLSFLTEKAETRILETVDQFVDRHLAHRFERSAGPPGDFVAVLQQNTQVLLQAMELLVKQQAEIWAGAAARANQQRSETEARLGEQVTRSLEKALDRTLETHTQRLLAWEKQTNENHAAVVERLAARAAAVCEMGRDQQAAVAKLVQGLTGQAQFFGQLQDGEQQLLRLQESLNQNLTSLAGAGAFEQAVHSLTAAIHLLTTRSAGLPGNYETSIKTARNGAAA